MCLPFPGPTTNLVLEVGRRAFSLLSNNLASLLCAQCKNFLCRFLSQGWGSIHLVHHGSAAKLNVPAMTPGVHEGVSWLHGHALSAPKSRLSADVAPRFQPHGLVSFPAAAPPDPCPSLLPAVQTDCQYQ